MPHYGAEDVVQVIEITEQGLCGNLFIVPEAVMSKTLQHVCVCAHVQGLLQNIKCV